MKAELEARIAELSEEIRHYPGPIARCDEHLPALLEERSKLIEPLKTLPGCTPAGIWDNEGGLNAA